MEKSIPSYMVSLSDNNFETLEELFEFMYSKCIHMYWILKDYSDDIEKLTYKSKDKKGTLKIEIVLSNKEDPKTVVNNIKKSVNDNDAEIKISYKKNVINIEISKNEAGLEIVEQ